MLGFALVIVLWVGGQEVLQHRISVGDFVAFTTYMIQLTWPVIALGWVINIFQRGTASMGRIDEILRQKPTIADDPALITVPANTEIRGEIEFRNLSFAYGHQSQAQRIAKLRRHGPLSSSVEARRHRPAQCQSQNSRRHQPRHRRPNRLRQVHPGLADPTHQ